MRQNTFLPIVMLALNADDVLEREEKILRDAGFSAIKPVYGVYKGEAERGWLVVISNDNDLKNICDLAWKYNQEAVLYSGVDRWSKLVYHDGSEMELGLLYTAPEFIARQRDCYTYDGETGLYWVTGKE
jgi:hypothetical protein